jgi:hypothetical protein
MRERDASASMSRHQAIALAPVLVGSSDDEGGAEKWKSGNPSLPSPWRPRYLPSPPRSERPMCSGASWISDQSKN